MHDYKQAFSGEMTLELGPEQTLELIELGEPGVSSTQTIAFIPELNALIVGDLVHHGMYVWLEGGIVDALPLARKILTAASAPSIVVSSSVHSGLE